MANNDLQMTFLNHVRDKKLAVTLFLANGIKLQGQITRFDNFCLLLERDGHSQLVFKGAISTISPTLPIRLNDGEAETPAAEPEKPFKVQLPPRKPKA